MQGALPETCLEPEMWVQSSINQTPNRATQDQPGLQRAASQPQASGTHGPGSSTAPHRLAAQEEQGNRAGQHKPLAQPLRAHPRRSMSHSS